MSKQGLLGGLEKAGSLGGIGLMSQLGGSGGGDGGNGFSPLMFLSPFLGMTESQGMNPFLSLLGLPGLFFAYKHRDKNGNPVPTPDPTDTTGANGQG